MAKARGSHVHRPRVLAGDFPRARKGNSRKPRVLCPFGPKGGKCWCFSRSLGAGTGVVSCQRNGYRSVGGSDPNSHPMTVWRGQEGSRSRSLAGRTQTRNHLLGAYTRRNVRGHFLSS